MGFHRCAAEQVRRCGGGNPPCYPGRHSTRPSLFDLAAVPDTIEVARELRKLYACVINAARARRNELDVAEVTEARSSLEELTVPVWSGQIAHRADFMLALRQSEGVEEYDAQAPAAQEITYPWTAIDRSVRAINSAYKSPRAMHRIAA